MCVCDRVWACSCGVRVYWSCEKAQEWAADFASNESGALPSERVSVGGDSNPEAEWKGEKTLHKRCKQPCGGLQFIF